MRGGHARAAWRERAQLLLHAGGCALLPQRDFAGDLLLVHGARARPRQVILGPAAGGERERARGCRRQPAAMQAAQQGLGRRRGGGA